MSPAEREGTSGAADDPWGQVERVFGTMHSMENDELATFLNALHLDECCQVQSVMKTSKYEVTELVTLPLKDGAVLGPFVRKRIRSEAPMGAAYEALAAAQRSGRRFRHLPAIHNVHDRGDEMVVLMEYVRGRTLHDEVYERDPSLALACELFPALCDGVIELHEDFATALIHRDLKPTNIIVNGSSLTIIDFGIARAFRDDAAVDTAPFATRAYAPPEQFGYGQTDVRSDVYALGMVLYFLLTERNPEADLVRRGFNEPEIPPALRRVLVRACAFDPQGRYQSVRALKGAFSEAVTATVGGAGAAGIAPAPAGVPRVAPVPVPPYPPASPTFPAPSVPAKPPLKVSEVFGALWDGFLALLWLIVAAVCLWLPFNPTPSLEKYPFAVCLTMYVGVALMFAGVVYALMDKRILRRGISFMKKQTFAKGLIVGGAMFAAGWVVMIAVAAVYTLSTV